MRVKSTPTNSIRKSELGFRRLAAAIISGDAAKVSQLLAASPEFAAARFPTGATRKTARAYFLDSIKRYLYAGDTPLHIAAAAYQADLVQALIEAGADVHAANRLGDQPIHAASVGIPGSRCWNPSAQAATIRCLVTAGADPNATDKRGVAPLHRAVRTRCAVAVKTLLECGADPMRPNGNGSTPMLLATMTTGRGGSGSAHAKKQQEEIVRILKEALSR